MPIRYEIRSTISANANAPLSAQSHDDFTSKITINAPALLFIHIKSSEIHTPIKINGDLEIVTSDGSSLIIVNYFTTATGSSIHFQDPEDSNNFIEYDTTSLLDEPTETGPDTDTSDGYQETETQTESTQHHTNSTFTASQLKLAIDHTEQSILQELFKKDEFTTGKYKISYNPATKKYIANDPNINFLEIAKKDFEDSTEELEDANDMAPEIFFDILENSIDELSEHRTNSYTFLKNGEACAITSILSKEGVYEYQSLLRTKKNPIAKGCFEYNGGASFISETFSAQEMLHNRDERLGALSDFKKINGSEAELIFKFNSTAYDFKEHNNPTDDQEAFLTEMRSTQKIDPVNFIKKANSFFTELHQLSNIHGCNFKNSIDLLIQYAKLEQDAKFSEDAFIKVEQTTATKVNRDEYATRDYLKIIEKKEINEKFYESVSTLSKTLEALKNTAPHDTQEDDEVEYEDEDEIPFSESNGYDSSEYVNDDHESHVQFNIPENIEY